MDIRPAVTMGDGSASKSSNHTMFVGCAAFSPSIHSSADIGGFDVHSSFNGIPTGVSKDIQKGETSFYIVLSCEMKY